MSDKVSNFLGDTPGRTLIKLAVISLIVGIIMSALNFTPLDVWYGLRDFVIRVYELGFEAFGRIGQYFLWGAMVVIPAFIFLRLIRFRG